MYAEALDVLSGILDMGTFGLEVKLVFFVGNQIVSVENTLVLANNVFDYSPLGTDY